MHGRNERVLRSSRRQPEAGEGGDISAQQSGYSKCGRRGAGPARAAPSTKTRLGGGALAGRAGLRAGQGCGLGRASAGTHAEGRGAEVGPRGPGQVPIGVQEGSPFLPRRCWGTAGLPAAPALCSTALDRVALQGDVPRSCTRKGRKHCTEKGEESCNASQVGLWQVSCSARAARWTPGEAETEKLAGEVACTLLLQCQHEAGSRETINKITYN